MFGLIILAFVVYYLFNSSNDRVGRSCSMHDQSQVKTSIDILNERYAKGEIDQDDFLERKQALSGQKQTISIKKDNL